MAFGMKDAAGVWQYGEDDTETTFSELLNLGQQSVSEAIKYFAGTSAERAAFLAPPPGALWRDTNGSQRLYDVGPDGNWRLTQGTTALSFSSWEHIPVGMAMRTHPVTLPVVLRGNETITMDMVATSAFAWCSVGSVVRNATNTVVQVRVMQLNSHAVVSYSAAWQIVSI